MVAVAARARASPPRLRQASSSSSQAPSSSSAPSGSGPIDLALRSGDRVAIVGRNGAGKTTLVRALTGDLPLAAGSAPRRPRRRASASSTQARDLVRRVAPRPPSAPHRGSPPIEARTLLAKFALGADDVERLAERLSPGERTRAALALLAARGVNCLILDEPTNHLDLEAIEELETALADYDGRLVVVSHDRRFLERLAVDRTITRVTIEALLPTDWPAVRAIYEEGLDVGTFEELVPTWEEWDRGHLVWPRLVARDDDGDGARLGGARRRTRSGRATAASPRTRSTSRREARGRGVGQALLAELVPGGGRRAHLDDPGEHPRRQRRRRSPSTSGAASGSSASREKLARKRGEWSDVVLMERRSALFA